MAEVLYSIVVPTYNSENSLQELVDRIDHVFKQNNWKYELIFVDDHSTDGSLNVIKKIASANRQVKYLSFRKNYGQHTAVLAGFRSVSGDFIITLDDDLQNPPEEIPKLINCINESDSDIVFAKFKEKRHTLFRRFGSKVINWLNARVVGKPKGLVLSNFRIIKREIINEVVIYQAANPYITGLLLKVTNNCSNVITAHHERKCGSSNYSLKKIFILVHALLFVFSDFMLKLVIRLGIVFSLLGFGFSGVVIIKSLLTGYKIQGWASTVFIVSFFSSISLFVIWVIGEYLIIVLKNAARESQYFIKESNLNK